MTAVFANAPHAYRVTKLHTSGMLAGMETTETTTVKFTEGREYKDCIGGGDYRVTKVEQVK